MDFVELIQKSGSVSNRENDEMSGWVYLGQMTEMKRQGMALACPAQDEKLIGSLSFQFLAKWQNQLQMLSIAVRVIHRIYSSYQSVQSSYSI